MTFEQVKTITDNIYQYIKIKKCKTYLSGPPQNFAISEAALNLGLSITGNPTDRRAGDKAIVHLRDNLTVQKQLSLSYYCMPIGVAFCYESIVAYSLYYHSKKTGDSADMVKTI